MLCAGLSKTYRDFWGRRAHVALADVDLRVESGESHALLGPNGSGKSTLLRVLLGLLLPSSGEAHLFGRPAGDPASRRGVGFLPEQTTLHAYLTCAESIALQASLHGASRAEAKRRAAALLERVGLAGAATRPTRELSLGMRRRVGLAAAFAGQPRLLILDEPTAGMDPLAREQVVELLREHVAGGGTLVVTSHLLGDISGIAQRATLLAEGRVIRTGVLESLLVRDGERAYRIAGPPSMDQAVSAAAEATGGAVLSAGAAAATIEQLFLETYRSRDDGGARGPS